MKETLEQRSKQFVSAQKTIACVQPLLSMYAYPVCAELFVQRGMEPDIKTMKQCERVLLKKAGLFSEFSGAARLLVLSLLSMSEDPEAKYDQLKEARDLVCRYFTPRPDYVALSTIVLCEETNQSHWEATAKKAADIYSGLQKKHRILTSGGDILLSLILARTGKDAETVTADAKTCAELLSSYKLDPKSLQGLCRVLSLSDGTPEEKCDRFAKLYELLGEHGLKYGKQYQIPMLGLAAMLPQDIEETGQDIMDVDHFLSKQDMYKGPFPKYSKTVRLMHSAMVVSGSIGGSANLYIAMEITIWMLLDILFI